MNDCVDRLNNIGQQSWRQCLLILILASPECTFAKDSIAQEVKDRTIAATVVIRTDSGGGSGFVRKNNWGQGDRAMPPEPGKDRYFVTAGGKVDDKNWEPGPDDWALFSEMMRDRVNSMREPKP